MSAQVDLVEPYPIDSDLYDYELSGDNETADLKRRFLSAYRYHGSVYHAALAVNVGRATVYRYLDNDPGFATALADCREDTYDQVETSVYRKALSGDSLLMMFYLKAHRPKFRDRMNIDLDSLRNEVKAKVESVLQERQVNSIEVESPANPSHASPVKRLLESALTRK